MGKGKKMINKRDWDLSLGLDDYIYRERNIGCGYRVNGYGIMSNGLMG